MIVHQRNLLDVRAVRPRRHLASSRRSSIIGSLGIIFYLLLPVEGILRKWVFNDIEQLLAFIRDPVLLAIYAVYFLQAPRRFPSWLARFCLFAGPFIGYALIHAMFSGTSPIIVALGLRAYVAYIPLAFILAEMLSAAHFRRFLIISLYLSIPVAILVYAQFWSLVESPINKGTRDDIESRFLVIAGVVRPYGPFTFVQLQNMFAAMMLAVTLIALEKRQQYAIPLHLIAAAAFATITMGALSGGRTFFGAAMLVCATYVLAGLTARRAREGIVRLATFSSFLAAFLIVFIVVFPTSFRAMSERQAVAEYVEGSTLLRVLGNFTDIVEPMNNAPFFGYGVGVGSNAVLAWTGQAGFIYGETEWGRMVNELGPVLGLLAIFARVILTIWLGWLCIKVTRATGDGSALIMFGFSGYLLLVAQTTGQNQLLSLCWLAVGLTLSLCRLARAEVSHSPPRSSDPWRARR